MSFHSLPLLAFYGGSCSIAAVSACLVPCAVCFHVALLPCTETHLPDFCHCEVEPDPKGKSADKDGRDVDRVALEEVPEAVDLCPVGVRVCVSVLS